MTQEEKQLLLKDLCARLFYEVMLNVNGYDRMLMPCDIDLISIDKIQCKPYLRPMSSITEEETNKLIFLCNLEADTENNGFFNKFGITIATKEHHCFPKIVSEVRMDIIDFLNSHNFDYRGLIEKGLAIEAPENMYKNKIY